jgi:hypothetical protein
MTGPENLGLLVILGVGGAVAIPALAFVFARGLLRAVLMIAPVLPLAFWGVVVLVWAVFEPAGGWAEAAEIAFALTLLAVSGLSTRLAFGAPLRRRAMWRRATRDGA